MILTSPSSSPSRRAFTLVELLVVIAIIAILAAITFGAYTGVKNMVTYGRAGSEMQAISVALEAYKVDNAVYPQITSGNVISGNPDPSADPYDYVGAGRELFFALTGTEKYGDAPTEKVYMTEIKKNMVATEDDANTGDHYFNDPWGLPYGYRALDVYDRTSNAYPPGYNAGSFDIWSTGFGQTTDEDDLIKWIVNWQDPIYPRRTAN